MRKRHVSSGIFISSLSWRQKWGLDGNLYHSMMWISRHRVNVKCDCQQANRLCPSILSVTSTVSGLDDPQLTRYNIYSLGLLFPVCSSSTRWARASCSDSRFDCAFLLRHAVAMCPFLWQYSDIQNSWIYRWQVSASHHSDNNRSVFLLMLYLASLWTSEWLSVLRLSLYVLGLIHYWSRANVLSPSQWSLWLEPCPWQLHTSVLIPVDSGAVPVCLLFHTQADPWACRL